MKIYYDGFNIEKYYNSPFVEGFTMNSTFIKQSGFTSYKSFFDKYKSLINNRPISFQVTSDNNIEEQTLMLSSLGDNIYVKISVINSNGDSNIDIIKKLLHDNIKINITCVFTKKQVNDILDQLHDITSPFIISLFCGGIIDSGIDPIPFVEYTTNLFVNMPNVEILWAGVKDNLTIINAKKYNCHIITIPDSIMERYNRIGLEPHKMSIDKVKLFNNDASNISIL